MKSLQKNLSSLKALLKKFTQQELLKRTLLKMKKWWEVLKMCLEFKKKSSANYYSHHFWQQVQSKQKEYCSLMEWLRISNGCSCITDGNSSYHSNLWSLSLWKIQKMRQCKQFVQRLWVDSCQHWSDMDMWRNHNITTKKYSTWFLTVLKKHLMTFAEIGNQESISLCMRLIPEDLNSCLMTYLRSDLVLKLQNIHFKEEFGILKPLAIKWIGKQDLSLISFQIKSHN